MRSSLVLALALPWFAACGDIDVKSVRVGGSVPEQLAGEWNGQWQSTSGSAGGSITLRMQDFEGEAVVSVQLDNPCIGAEAYQFRVEGNVIELLADGVVLFSAVLGDDRTLVGTYGCSADLGVWEAEWIRELPTLVDLGGRWEGLVNVPGIVPQPAVLQIGLSVDTGALVVDGTVQFPTLAPTLLPVHGAVQFRATAFDIALDVSTGTSLGIQLLGIGDVAARRIDTGLLRTNGDPSVPFTTAGWTAQWISP